MQGLVEIVLLIVLLRNFFYDKTRYWSGSRAMSGVELRAIEPSSLSH
jgi:hypothetical protein